MTDTARLFEAASALRVSFKRRLLLWTIRWLITFGVIGAIVYFNPTLSWLWWVGAALALVSLGLVLVLHVVLQRRLALSHQRIAEYERAAAGAEREALRKGDVD